MGASLIYQRNWPKTDDVPVVNVSMAEAFCTARTLNAIPV
jgi:hypothetical protein